VLVLSASALSACATKPPASDPDALEEYQQTNDPLEPTNRFFFKVDNALERYTIRPLSKVYVTVLPQPVRNGLHNIIVNLHDPVTFVDDVGQANATRAGVMVGRFVINTTLGIGGAFDIADRMGLAPHSTDFGVTLATWGIPGGPYLYLPLLGPGSPRGVVGYGIDIAANPFTWVPHGYGLLTMNTVRGGVAIVDEYSRFSGDLDHIRAGALDPYATFRSLYRQNMAAQVKDAEAGK